MTVVYFDTDYPKEHIVHLAEAMKDKLNDEVLFVPKSFEVLLDCPVDRLEAIKAKIEEAIKLKENK
jgi:hypothetical protein